MRVRFFSPNTPKTHAHGLLMQLATWMEAARNSQGSETETALAQPQSSCGPALSGFLNRNKECACICSPNTPKTHAHGLLMQIASWMEAARNWQGSETETALAQPQSSCGPARSGFLSLTTNLKRQWKKKRERSKSGVNVSFSGLKSWQR